MSYLLRNYKWGFCMLKQLRTYTAKSKKGWSTCQTLLIILERCTKQEKINKQILDSITKLENKSEVFCHQKIN